MVDSSSVDSRPRGNRVANKIAIVTGGGAGIGRTTAKLLAREGATVVVADRNTGNGEETVRQILAADGRARFIPTDVSVEADCVRLVEETVAAYERVDVLANIAGIYPRSSLAETTIEFWRHVFATNLEGPFVLCREVVPHMVRNGGGSIINMGSGNGLAGGANLVAYSAAKGGLLTLTRNIAAAYSRDGVRVNYLIPGWVLTDNERVTQNAEGHDEAWLAALAPNLQGGRFSTPEDAALAILYLASDESAFVNGTILNTDGGSSMLPSGLWNVTARGTAKREAT